MSASPAPSSPCSPRKPSDAVWAWTTSRRVGLDARRRPGRGLGRRTNGKHRQRTPRFPATGDRRDPGPGRHHPRLRRHAAGEELFRLVPVTVLSIQKIHGLSGPRVQRRTVIRHLLGRLGGDAGGPLRVRNAAGLFAMKCHRQSQARSVAAMRPDLLFGAGRPRALSRTEACPRLRLCANRRRPGAFVGRPLASVARRSAIPFALMPSPRRIAII